MPLITISIRSDGFQYFDGSVIRKMSLFFKFDIISILFLEYRFC